MTLNRQDSVPLYLQLKEMLLHKIDTGELKPHDRLLSERDLRQAFGVSRMTVRKALNELTYEGRVYSRVGKGTYVAEPKIDQNLQVLTGFTEDMRSRGLVASARLLEADLIPASTKLATTLHLQPGAEVARLQRLRLADRVPMALETAYLPHHLCPNVLQHDLATRSLYEILRTRYGLKLAKAKQTIEATSATEREAQLLDLSVTDPVLLMERTTFLEGGQVIEYVKSAYRGDKYKFHVVLIGTG